MRLFRWHLQHPDCWMKTHYHSERLGGGACFCICHTVHPSTRVAVCQVFLWIFLLASKQRGRRARASYAEALPAAARVQPASVMARQAAGERQTARL